MKEKVLDRYRKIVDDQGDTLARLLVLTSNHITDEVLQSYNSKQVIKLTMPQYDLMQMLCLHGMNATSLATRLNITKQAVGQFVNELEKMGLIERCASPNDSRSKIIRHTKKGYRVVSDLIDSSIAVEEEVIKKIGIKSYKAFTKLLVSLAK